MGQVATYPYWIQNACLSKSCFRPIFGKTALKQAIHVGTGLDLSFALAGVIGWLCNSKNQAVFSFWGSWLGRQAGGTGRDLSLLDQECVSAKAVLGLFF